MNRWTVLLATLFLMFVAVGCSSGGGTPTAPTAGPDLTGSSSHVGQAQTHLWGYYDVYIDVENQTVEAVLNRMCMFTANVTTFVNNPVSNLSFEIYGTPATADYVDVDIDVTIKHPFPGMTEYNGYDVKGVFMGTGSATMKYSTKLKYAEYGTDQAVYDFNDKASLAYTDPYGDELVGMPDGYTRWFNAKEFIFPGIMGYTAGKLATPAYTAMLTATLNGYKYFADGLGADEDLWTWLGDNADTNGVFSAGTSNTRNYYLRFPTSGGVKYGYAVVASWIDADTHPANAPEAAACKIDIEPDIYYISSTKKGGDLILDLGMWSWEYQPTMIKIESTVLTAVHTFDATEMTATGGGANYSTYHCEIPANNITGTEGNEFWVIAEYGDFDYTCDATPPGGAPAATLAAFFRSDLYVSPVAYNAPPEIVSGVDGEDNPFIAAVETYTVVATDPDGDPLTYSWTVTDVGSATELLSDDPGNGDGTIDIDWGALGAEDGGEYDVDCDVSDGTDETPATTLTAIGTAVIYLYDGTVDDGDMAQVGFGAGPANWTFLEAQDVWDENGNTATGDYGMCRTLATPKMNIPTGVSSVRLEITHSGSIGDYYGYYSFGSGMVGYTTDGGTSINFNETPCSYSATWLSFNSGQNFNHTKPYGNLGFYGSYPYWLGCSPWSYWNYTVFCDTWGSLASPVTTNWTTVGLLGKNDVQICFNYNSCPYNWVAIGDGWHLKKVKVYVVP